MAGPVEKLSVTLHALRKLFLNAIKIRSWITFNEINTGAWGFHETGGWSLKQPPKDSFYWYQKVIATNGKDLD